MAEQPTGSTIEELEVGMSGSYERVVTADDIQKFGEVTGDEVALVKRIFSFLKMPFSADNEAGVRAWITMDSKRGHQVATATLEDFGLKSSVIEERLADYFKNYADFL